MAPKRTMTAFLLESERITSHDVERGLEYQRRHGGYLGEALVELGLVRREEIDWALASQLDLPFIFPDAESADREATRLVTPAWALAHLAVPIVHGGDSITVVVADPLDRDTLDELAERTGLEVEMALASASRIRALIRSVYGSADEPSIEPGGEIPTDLDDFLTEALAHGAERIGVSARGTRAQGWWVAGGVRERRRLDEGWHDALEAALDPPPFAAAHEVDGTLATFEARLSHAGTELVVDVQAMASLSGTELLLRPRRPLAVPRGGWELPPDVRADLRLLAAGGRARVGVTGPAAQVNDVLAQLPALVLGESARAAHVALEDDLPGVFTLRPGEEQFGAVLEGYAFDALTADLPLNDARLPVILAAAPLCFARLPHEVDPADLAGAGIDWVLTVPGPQGIWDLRAGRR